MSKFAVVQPNDPPYLRAAIGKLGLSEIAGPQDEPQVLAMYAACGHPEVKHDEIAWCAAFVGWALKQGGLPNTGSLLAISYAKYGTPLDRHKPIPRGAIAVWHREGGNHVNFVLHDDGMNVVCIGGNQGNGRGGGVTVSAREKEQAIAYRMPSGVVVPLPKPKPKPAPAPKPQDTEQPDPQAPAPKPTQPDDPGPEQDPDDAKLPFWKRWWKKLTAGGLGLGGLGLGGMTLDASTIYALCVLIVVLGIGALIWWKFIREKP